METTRRYRIQDIRAKRPFSRSASWFLTLCAAIVFAQPATISAARTAPKPSEHFVSTPEQTHELACRAGAPRPQDEIWLISTRGLCRPRFQEGTGPALAVKRFDGQAGWRPSSLADFFGADAGAPTLVFAHGNRVESFEAAEEGWAFYSALLRCAAQPPAMRYVIWSWPSDQVRGPIRDARCKAERSNSEGVYLAWFLSRIDYQTPVSLVGYSYGARVITGGLHLLGGGCLMGRRLAMDEPTRAPYQVVLLAAALHNYWLSPGAFHGKAPEPMDRMLVLYNSCDPVLRRYRVVDKCGNPEALGYTGMCNLAGFDSGDRQVEQHNVCCLVGESHSLDRYLCSSQLMDHVRRYALWGPLEDL